jgi:molybdopterin molybdotransferase
LVSTRTRLPDKRAATEAGLDAALWHSDVVIVSGGVSVGPHDHIKPALVRLGVKEQFWGVALKPGKPTWFGTKEGKLVFGLPGNPVSAVVTFVLFAAPALRALQGAAPPHGSELKAVLGTSLALDPRRAQAIRVRLEHDPGRTIALPNGPQSSHIVSSLLGADGLALLDRGQGEIGAGEPVTVERLPN